ncbi:SF3a splicing factor complex subunit [Coemansia erecta]|uniref:SF3a splicing factor complex subunit n=1 Tax=Coemansia erecta TaxID=147472 RepID=A0A9W7XXX6_9FUNG|nr:SF3a splicing factor complex subunit [Coemansia erecta]
MGDADMHTGAAAKPAMIYPPQDIRTIIDKTAAHVAKSGAEFEKLLQDRYQGNARFAFMQPTDPYHAYYAHRVSQQQQQHAGEEEGKAGEDEPMDVDVDAREDQINEEEEEEDYTPATEQFSGSLPLVSAHDLDVLRLTAQFVARNGRSFLHQLMRQHPAGHFAFAQPAHSLYGYFQAMVAQYSAVMFPPPDLVRALEQAAAAGLEGKSGVLERAGRRMRRAERRREEEERLEEERRREREEVAAIDWQDFQVVGAVEFVLEDEHAALPPPLLLRDVQTLTLSAAAAAAAAEPAAQPAAEPPTPAVPAIPAAPSEPAQPAAPAPPGMRIRHDYVPTLRRGQAAATVHLRCQLCGQDVPASQFDEHLRVELVDPRWKEQKTAYERRFRDSNLVQDGGDIARYLRRLAHASAEEQGGAEDAPRAVPWDGFSATAGRAVRRARDMHAVAQDAPAVAPDIGPAAGPPAAGQASRKRAKNAKTATK